MHLVDSLCAGIRGAENGVATLYARGTSTPATWWASFEADGESTAPVSLDSNGGAAVYVNQLVDVVVTDTLGNEVRRFVAGSSAPAIEVISQSFIGVDYENGASAASKPTTLQSVLDRLKTSTGTTDFNVLIGGVATSLQAALSGNTLYFNVKSSAYGAAGNGTTDDTSAIQSAINAASAAGGGTVFFPPGTYRTTAALTLPGTVSLLGAGATATAIRIAHATADTISVSSASTLAYQTISGLRIAPSQVNTGALLACSSTLLAIDNCVIGDDTNTTGSCITSAANAVILAMRSYIQCTGASGRAFAGGSIWATDTQFYQSFVGAYAPTDGLVVCTGITMKGCLFSTSSTSGTYSLVHWDGPNTASIAGTRFGAGTGTVTAIAIDSYSGAGTSAFHETGNSFIGSVLPYSYTVSVAALYRVQLATRERLHATVSTAADTTLRSDLYGSIHVQITSNAAIVLTLNGAPEGAHLSLIIDNDSGGVSGNISFSANVRTVAASTLAAAEIDTYIFKSLSVDGTLQWVLQGQQQGL